MKKQIAKSARALAIHQIRSRGVSHINRLVPAARHLDILRSAFAEWNGGDVYVCKKTGDYRYRYGSESKHICQWSSAAREVFATPGAFALAALVFATDKPVTSVAKPVSKSPAAAPAKKPVHGKNGKHTGRADVVRMAIAGRAA